MRLGEWSYFLAAIALSAIAILFGLSTTVYVNHQGGGGVAPNIVGAASTLGFALASGLCFLASALVSRGDRP
jgi:hypothetical protein